MMVSRRIAELESANESYEKEIREEETPFGEHTTPVF